MGAGFKIQIVNATPHRMRRTYSHLYQMEWNPIDQVGPNAVAQFYGEFKETIFKFSIDDAADATYVLDGVSGFAIKLHAKKKGVDNLPSPNPPSESGYGLLVKWENVPPGIFVYPPLDVLNQSPAGWIHDGVVTIAIASVPGLAQQKLPRYPTPNYTDYDWTALRPSVKHWAKTWMEQFHAGFDGLKLTELTLPGSHDAGTLRASGITQPWVQTQYLSLHQQLEQGIRALDIRLSLKGTGDDRFQFCHGDYLTNLSFLEGVQQINNFLDETRKEIVILDFHRFEGSWRDEDFKDLARLIRQKFAGGKLIPAFQKDDTIGQLLDSRGRVLVGMGSYSGNLPQDVVIWLQANTEFWTDAVEQYWCGTSITTWDNVQNYMNGVLDGTEEPKDHLWALMAQYNYAIGSIGQPANVPIEVSGYFAGEHGLRSNIVHTDWWNRVNSAVFHGETSIPNFSVLLNAVPLNLLKGYRRRNGLKLYEVREAVKAPA